MKYRLSELPFHTEAVVTKLNGESALTRRLQSMGLTEGASIAAIMKSPFGDPTAYLVGDTLIALRKTDCAGIWVTVREAENE